MTCCLLFTLGMGTTDDLLFHLRVRPHVFESQKEKYYPKLKQMNYYAQLGIKSLLAQPA